MLALCIGVILQSIVGLIQYFTNAHLGLEVLGESSLESLKEVSRATFKGGAWVYRVGALLGHSNLLSAYLALTLQISIALVFAKVKWWQPYYDSKNILCHQRELFSS